MQMGFSQKKIDNLFSYFTYKAKLKAGYLKEIKHNFDQNFAS